MQICQTQWAALALPGPSGGSLVGASSVWVSVVSEPVLLSLVPSSMAPSGTLSLSSDAPSSPPGRVSSSSGTFGFPESKKHKSMMLKTQSRAQMAEARSESLRATPGACAGLDSASSPSLLLLSPWEFCWGLFPCVAQMCFSSSASTQVRASLAPLSPTSLSRSDIRLRAASSAAEISAEIFSMSTSTFRQHSFKVQQFGI